MVWIRLRSSVCLGLGVAACAAGVLGGCGQSSSGSDGVAAAGGGMGVGAHGGGEGGSDLACGMVLFTTPHDAPECEAWTERNCCDDLEACAASTPCRTIVACINACSPMSRSCIGCCTQGLTALPPELDTIASCSKLGETFPAGCEWPRTSEL